MSHVADSPIVAISSPFQGVLPPSGHKSALRAEWATHFLAPGKRGWSPPSPWPLFSRLTLPAPRSAPHVVTSGVKSCVQTLPRCLPPATDRRIAKDATRPNYADWSSSFSISPDGRFLRTNQTVLPHSPPPNR